MKKPRSGLFAARLPRVLLFLPALLSCEGCGKDKARAPTPVANSVLAEGLGEEPEIELGIGDTSLLPFAGEVDARNRYASAVLISLSGEPDAEPRCSGVLLGPQLVLTAGSCVCTPKKAQDGALGRTLIDASACMERVFVTTVLTETTEKEFRTYRGEVRPHPELQVILDARGSIISSRADLAAVHLDERVEGSWHVPLLTETEAQLGESLIMAGFAHDEHRRFGGVYGIRYSRKNPVTKVLEHGRVLYRQQGAYLYDGYAGGPCLREEADEHWLVGIAGTGTNEDLSFTSTFFFRDWVRSELGRTARKSTEESVEIIQKE